MPSSKKLRMFLWRKYLIITLFASLCILGKNEGVKIMKCKVTKLTVYEDAPEPITCSRLTTNGTNIWRHHDDDKIIGECSAEGNCTNNFNRTCTLSRDPFSTDSRLTIISNFRYFSSVHITCEDKESQTSHSCLIIIKRQPVLSDCQVHTTSGNVSGSCFADKFFSSDGLYLCDWMMKGPEGQRKRITPGFWGNTKTCNKDYCRGTCSFSHPLPKEKGIYNYTIMVLNSPKGTFSQQVIIGVKIMNCKVTKLTVYEDAPEPITCSRLTRDGTNIWRHHDDDKIIGECSAEGNCTNYFNRTCTLSRDPFSTESRLTIISNFREFSSGRITCEDKESQTSHNCLLIIKRHPVLSDCQVHTTSGNVSGSCFADKFFSSDGLYPCDWMMKGPEGQRKRITPGSWGNTKICSKDYCRGTCSFSHPQPKEKGIYNYTIRVLDSAKGTFSQQVIIGASPEITEDSNYVGMIIGVVVTMTLVIAGLIAILVFYAHKKKQIQNQAIRPKRQNEDYEHHINVVYNFKEKVAVPQKAQERNQYVESTGPSLQSLDEGDRECYDVICEDGGKSDDEELYHKIFDDTLSHETLPTLSSEQELEDL